MWMRVHVHAWMHVCVAAPCVYGMACGRPKPSKPSHKSLKNLQALRALRVQAGSMVRRHVPASACVTRLAIGVSYAKATPQPTLSSVLGKAADNHAAAGPSVMSLAAEAARLREVLPQLQAEGDDDLALAVRLQQEELSAAKQKPKRGGAKMKTLDSYWRPNDAKKSKHN